jgi:hypothetical protein
MSLKSLVLTGFVSLTGFAWNLAGAEEGTSTTTTPPAPELKAFPIDFKALSWGQEWKGSGNITEPIKKPEPPKQPPKPDPKKDPKGKPATGKEVKVPPPPPPKPEDPSSWQQISINWDEKGQGKGTFIGAIQRVGPGSYSSYNNAYTFVVTYKGVCGPTGVSVVGSFDPALTTFKGTVNVPNLGKGEVELKRPDPSIPDATYAGAWTCDLTAINKDLVDDFSKELVITLPKDKSVGARATLPANAQIDVYPFRWTESNRELILAVEYKAKGSKTTVRGSLAGTFNEKKTAYTAYLKVGTIFDTKLVLNRPEPKAK